MSRKNNLIVLSVVFVLVFYTHSSQAFVAQDINDALSFNNVARSVNPTKAESPSSTARSAKNKENVMFKFDSEPIDYLEIADKLITNTQPEKFFVDMRNKTSQSIAARPGQTFFVILPEDQESFWKTDGEENLVEIVSSEHSQNNRILEFRTLCCGETKIFLDNLVKQQNKHTVLQSKILRLRVKK